jgi:hypothetical protein
MGKRKLQKIAHFMLVRLSTDLLFTTIAEAALSNLKGNIYQKEHPGHAKSFCSLVPLPVFE